MNIDHRAIIAAKNNADWYGSMFKSYGCRYERRSYAFIGLDTPPPYYSNLTTLDPKSTDMVFCELSKLAPRFNGALAVKDSFCCLKIEENGFQSLFEASWIWREAQNPLMPPGWKIITSRTDLREWEVAWKGGGSPTDHEVFKEELLSYPDVYFFGRKENN